MGSKKLGRIKRQIREHGLVQEQKTCSECAWFSVKFPELTCLKWDKPKAPDDLSCSSFLRRQTEGKKFILIGEWCRDYNSKESFEDYGYVLDFMPHGHPENRRPIHKREPLAQIVGEKYFTLLEVSIKEGENPAAFSRVYIGKGERDVVKKVKRKLHYKDLTEVAKERLPKAVNIIVARNISRFVEFFNKPFYISSKLHSFGLLAFVNEKKLIKLIKERQKRPFADFVDLLARTDINLIKSISNRALCELKCGTKHFLFVAPKSLT